MNSNQLPPLEFEKILDRIAGFSHCETTAAAIGKIAPIGSRLPIEARFGLVSEIRQLFRLGIDFPLDRFDDITMTLSLAQPEGAVLSPLDLALLVPNLGIGAAMKKLLDYRTDIPLLKELATNVTGFPEILQALQSAIGPDGELLDTASPLLFDLRQRVRQLTNRVRRRLEEIVRERETAIFLQDDFITQRNGRWVIPVRMDSKGMVPGVVHDVSNSGETAFMEPIEIIGMVNELENLHAEEKGEQIRILRDLTDWVREEADSLQAEFETLVKLDFHNAIARFSELISAGVPIISDNQQLIIRQGYHPLLLLMHIERGGKPVVPLDLSLGDEPAQRILLITGPNTGGKTIAIKTAGLLTLMAGSGIPVPAASGSVFPLSANLLADIGDEQSIEESLSTFSAHIRKITNILNLADNRAIILLDELGTGTDPSQGAALACGILSELRDKGCIVLATTHLIDIVAFVQKSEGMINGAMEFDRETLTPGYRLTTGEPGQSHTLEIARNCGFPERILSNAEQMVGRMESDFHSLLADLREQRRRQETLLNDIARRESFIISKENSIAEKMKELESMQRESRAKALQEAKSLVQSARREINQILDEARKERNRKSAERLAGLETEIEGRLLETGVTAPIDENEIKPGMTLFVKVLGKDATVVSVDKRHSRLRVKTGGVEIETPIAGVEAAKGKSGTADRKRSRLSIPLNDETSAPPSELNLLGNRLDEALARLDKYLDQAALHGYREVRIIHGIGTGVLLKGVREHLARHPLVAEYREGERFEGGNGATVARLI